MPMPKRGKFVTVDGVKTHYYEKGRGPTIVLVHGGNFGSSEASGNSWTWSRNFDYLAKNFHVVAVDKLGQGYTGNPKSDSDYTMHADRDQFLTSALIFLAHVPAKIPAWGNL